MPLKDCSEKSKKFLPEAHIKALIEKAQKYQAEGMDQGSAERKAVEEYAAQRHRELHDELNGLRKKTGLKAESYEPLTFPERKAAEGKGAAVVRPSDNKAPKVAELSKPKIDFGYTLNDVPPPDKEGRTPVTVSGLTEDERQQRIAERKKETTLPEEKKRANAVIDKVKKYNELPNGFKGKTKVEGLRLLNDIRNEASALGYTFDERAGRLRDKKGNPVRMDYAEAGDAAIREGAKTLMDRSDRSREVFHQLIGEGVLPNIYRLDGKKMSVAEMDKAVNDVVNGIPSERATNMLDQLEAYDKRGLYEIGDSQGKTGATLDQLLGTHKQNATEPMTEDMLHQYLSEQAGLSPEHEQNVIDHLENLLKNYEPEQKKPVGEVQQPQPETKERTDSKAEPDKQPEQDAPKPGSESAEPAKPEPVKEPTPVEKGVTALKKAVEEGKLKGIYADEVKRGNTEGVLKDISQQAHGVDSDGKPLEGGGREKAMIDLYGKDVVDAAKEAFPYEPKEEAKAEAPKEETKSEGKGGDQEPPKDGEKTEEAKKDEPLWTAIRRAELTDAKNNLRKMGISWGETMSKALGKLAADAGEGRTLHEAARSKIKAWAEVMNNNHLFNPTSEELAVMQYFRTNTEAQMKNLHDQAFSPIDVERQAAWDGYDQLAEDRKLVDAVLGGSASEAGRAFMFRQSEGKLDPEGTLKLRRMQVSRGGGKFELSRKAEQEVEKTVEAEEALKEKIRQHKEQQSKERFDQAVKEEVERQLKAKGRDKWKDEKARTSKEKSKAVADRLRNLADKLENFGKADLPEGTERMGASLQKAVADAIRYIADKLESSELPDLIHQAVRRFKGTEDEDAVRNEIKNQMKVAGFTPEEVDAPTGRDAALEKIKTFAKNANLQDINGEMLAKGMVSDFVHAHLDLGMEPKDVLPESLKGLQEVFPTLTDQDLRDAYLQEGKYRLPTEAKIKSERAQDVLELKSISKLETDLQDLNDLKELRKRGKFNERERSPHEKELLAKKEAELSKIREERKQIAKAENKDKNKAEKLKELDEQIKDLEDRNKMWEIRRKKSDRQIDRELEDKKKKRNEILNKKGIRLDRSSSYQRASREKVADAHNENADNLSKKIGENLNDGLVHEDLKGTFEAAKQAIDNSKVEVNTAQDLAQALNQGVDKVKAALTEVKKQIQKNAGDAEKSKQLSELRNDLQGVLNDYRDVNERSEADIATDGLKRNLRSKIKDYDRKMANKEFDKPERRIPGRDVESVALEVEKNKIFSTYKRIAEEERFKNMNKFEKAAAYVQASRVASLIFNIGGLAKIISTGIFKPVMEPITRATVGIVGSKLPLLRQIRKAAGSEGFSGKAEMEALKAEFGSISEAKLLAKTDKALNDATDASNEYRRTMEEADRLKQAYGEGSDEYKKYMTSEAKNALNKYNAAQVNYAATAIHKWIGASAWKDASEVFVHNAAHIEEQFGNIKRIDPHELETSLEKYSYYVDAMGRIHSMIKNFSARNFFARSYVMRLENMAKRGEDISNPEAWTLAAAASYGDFLQGKFMQDNALTNIFKEMTSNLEKGGSSGKFAEYKKVAATVFKWDTPIVRVPTNILGEAVFEYALGSIISGFKTLYEADKGFTVSKRQGADFKTAFEAMNKHLSTLPPDKADAILRAFRKGGVGMGMFVLGAIAHHSFGGFYQKGDPKKKEDDIDYDRLMFGETLIERHVSKAILHNPFFVPFALGANYVREREISKREHAHTALASVEEGMMADINGIIEQLPYSNAIPSSDNLSRPFQTPPVPGVGLLKDYSEIKEEFQNHGELVKRSPQGFMDQVKMMSGFRSSVPTKEVGDEIKKIKASYTKQIKDAYKSGYGDEYAKQLHEAEDQEIEQAKKTKQ